MQKIIIKHLGPIEECELEIQNFIVCTGEQASGKSTIAKSIFFFKNMKNILFLQFKKNCLIGEEVPNSIELSFKNRFFGEIRSNFLQIFGSTRCMVSA